MDCTLALGPVTFSVCALEVNSAGGATGDGPRSCNTKVITVVANLPPSITSSPPATRPTVGGLYEYPVVATDPNNDTLTFMLPIAPTGMSINSATGLITWTPTAQQVAHRPCASALLRLVRAASLPIKTLW